MGYAKIGPFTVLAQLGAGAGSQVFHIRREADEKEFALKIVATETPSRLKYLQQLRHEFVVGKLLDHPRIVKMYAFEKETDWLFRPKKGKLLLEFAPGRSAQYMPRLCCTRWLRIFQQVASALAHMHSKGIYHADLKPDNLIVGPRDSVKVIDFGLAAFKGELETRVHGTPEYMAPETKLRKVIDEQTDLFNFGATMYRLLTFRHVPLSMPGVAFNQRTYSRSLIPVTKLNQEVPDELGDVVHWCINYDPAERPRRAVDVQNALRNLAREWSTE